MRKLHPEFDFWLGGDSWIEDDSHIFWILYYRDSFKCIQLLLAYLLFQVHLDFELVHLAESVGHPIYTEMDMGDWRWDTLHHLLAGVMIVPVICASYKTQLTNFSGDQHAWQLYLTVGNIRKDIRCTCKNSAWICTGPNSCPPKRAKYMDKALHNAVWTVLSQLCHLDITGPGLKWDSADGFQRQWYPLLAAWVGDYPEQVMVAEVTYG